MFFIGGQRVVSRQLSDRLLGISYPRSCLCASSLCNVFFISRSLSHISVLKINPVVKNTSEMLSLRNCLLGIFNISRYRDLLSICRSPQPTCVHWPTERRQLFDSLLEISYRRSCFCATERRVVLGLKVRIVWRCYTCAVAHSCVAAPAACCCRAAPCDVRFSWASMCNNMHENKMTRSVLPNNIIMRRASAKRESGKCCGRSFSVPTRRGCRLSHDCWMPLNAADIAAVARGGCELILHREAGCTRVKGSDNTAVVSMRCFCCRAVRVLLLHTAADLCRVLCVFSGPECATT